MTYFFYWSLYSSLCMKFFWWIPLLIYFVFGNFSINQKKWLTWPGGADKLQAILLKWLTALLGSLTVILTALLFWNYFYLLTFAFVLEWFSPHWEILIIFFPCFPVNSCQTRRGELSFITQLLLNLMLIEMVFAIF